MKTVITIENGKVEISIDDGEEPKDVTTSIADMPMTVTPHGSDVLGVAAEDLPKGTPVSISTYEDQEHPALTAIRDNPVNRRMVEQAYDVKAHDLAKELAGAIYKQAKKQMPAIKHRTDTKPSPKTEKTKDCVVCGTPFSIEGRGAHRRTKCEKHRDSATTKVDTHIASETPAPQEPKVIKDEANDMLLPTVESAAQAASKAMQSSGITIRKPEPAPKHSPAILQNLNKFDDPYNCQSCRDDEQICRFHRSLNDGMAPTKFKL